MSSTAAPAPSALGRPPAELPWRRSVAVLTGRNAKRLLRSPVTLVQSVCFPTLLLLTLLAAFGRVIGGSVSDYAARMVPQLVVAAGAFGAAGTGIAVHTDRVSGMIDRLRALPIDRRGYLAAAVVADALRAAAAAAVLVVIGHAFGFRFHQGVAAMIGFFGIAAAFSTIWAWLAVRVGLVASASEAVGSAMNGPVLMLFFLSSGFVPVAGFPGWLQPVVRANPLSVAVEALIGLSAGGPVLVPVLQTAAWITALTLLLAPSAVRRYRSLAP
ncbi:MAG TPA: ABC transporter permease [Acidimicrobiales bacterium]|nr:ABC transporter permease [Acidimicrobiales bacterium]